MKKAVSAAASASPAATLIKMSGWRHLGLSAFWFANQLHWGALATILIESESARMSAALGNIPDKANITGAVFGYGSVVAAVVPPLVGALSDRCLSPLGRRRPYVIAGTLVNIAGLYLLWLAFSRTSLPGYILSFLVVQLGNNIALGAYSGIIPDVVPEGQRGTASGYMAAMSQLGTIVGLIAAGQLMSVSRQNDLLCVTFIAGALLLFGAVTVLSVREAVQTSRQALKIRELVQSFWIDPRVYPDFAWVWLTRALFTGGWWLIQPVLLPYLADAVHVADPAKTLSFLGAVVLIGATVTGILGGMVSDRWGRKRLVFLAGVIMAGAAVAFAAITMAGRPPLAWVFAIAVPWGFGYGTYISVDWALGTDVLPHKEHAGKDMGIWHLSMVLPQAFAPPLAARILKEFTHGGAVLHYSRASYALVFLAAAVILLLSASLIWRVRSAR